MMSVSNDFKQAVDSMERNIVGKLEIYFDGESSSPITFYRDMIIDFKILEEASADSQNPLGVVSSNELTISLHNKSSVFTISNANSPYYNKIRKNVLIKPYIGVTLENEEIEYIQMGKYYIDDWKSPSNSLETSVTAYDRLYYLGQLDAPDLQIMIDVDIKYVFISLFTALGLTANDYIIDNNISCRIQYVWLQDTVRSMLQMLCATGNCTVSMTRYGKIYVKSNNTNIDIVATLRDSTQTITAQNIETYNSIFSKVDLTYNLIALSDTVELVSIKKYSLKVGVNSFNNISFSNTPVLVVKKVSLLGSTASIQNIKYGANYISFDVKATKEEIVDILVIGIYIIKNNSKFTTSNNEVTNDIGEVKLDIKSDIIQDIATAKAVADDVLNIVSMKNSKYTVTSRGNPTLELMDNIIIDDISDKIYNAPITILKQEITWDGTLNIDIEGRSLVRTVLGIKTLRIAGVTGVLVADTHRSISNTLAGLTRRVSKTVTTSAEINRRISKNTQVNIDALRPVIRAVVIEFNSNEQSNYTGTYFICNGALNAVTTRTTIMDSVEVTGGVIYSGELIDINNVNSIEDVEVIE